eukprot:239809-Prymnesium_polylepis.1
MSVRSWTLRSPFSSSCLLSMIRGTSHTIAIPLRCLAMTSALKPSELQGLLAWPTATNSATPMPARHAVVANRPQPRSPKATRSSLPST